MHAARTSRSTGEFVDRELTLLGIGAKIEDRHGGPPMEIKLTATLLEDDTLDGEAHMQRGPAEVDRRTAWQVVFVTRKFLSRRAALKGIGATVALPFLDAMTPALARAAAPARAAADVHREGPRRRRQLADRHPEEPVVASGDGHRLRSGADQSPVARAVPRPPDDRQQHRRAHGRSDDGAGDRRRSFPLERGVPHPGEPKRTEGRDVEAGISLDQLYAQRFGQDTPIPSMQLCIEPVNQAGGCGYGYSCAYMDSISWESPTTPLPMIRDPRVVFDELFGVFGSGATPAERRERRAEDRSILDWVLTSSARLGKRLGPADRARLNDYLEQRPRGRAPHPDGGAYQRPRRDARAARGAGWRARLVRRARQADVRSAGARLPRQHHARLRLQAGSRRLEPRLSRRAASPAHSTTPRTTAPARSGSWSSRRSTRIT